MTRSQIVKSAFRVLTLKLGQANVPMIMTNHTYDVIGSMFPQKEMGGGSGLKYAASSIIYLGKRKEKDGTEVVGNIIHCKNYKSRITKENAQIDVRLTYKTGLDKYYGLLELAEGVFKKVSTRYETAMQVRRLVSQSMVQTQKSILQRIYWIRLMNTQNKNSPTDKTKKSKRDVFAQKDTKNYSCIKITEGKFKDVIYLW